MKLAERILVAILATIWGMIAALWVIYGIVSAHNWYVDRYVFEGYRHGVMHGCNYMEQIGDRPSDRWMTNNWRVGNEQRWWNVDPYNQIKKENP